VIPTQAQSGGCRRFRLTTHQALFSDERQAARPPRYHDLTLSLSRVTISGFVRKRVVGAASRPPNHDHRTPRGSMRTPEPQSISTIDSRRGIIALASRFQGGAATTVTARRARALGTARRTQGPIASLRRAEGERALARVRAEQVGAAGDDFPSSRVHRPSPIGRSAEACDERRQRVRCESPANEVLAGREGRTQGDFRSEPRSPARSPAARIRSSSAGGLRSATSTRFPPHSTAKEARLAPSRPSAGERRWTTSSSDGWPMRGAAPAASMLSTKKVL